MSKDLILGIDVGTTSVKAGIVDESGTVQSSFSERYDTMRLANGIVQQDPDDWLRLIDRAFDQFHGESLTSGIASIGLCSQVNTHVFVGADGLPLLPAILWQDGRASQEAAELDGRVTEEQKCRWWGAPMPIDASHVLPRMLWVKRHHPELWRQTRWVMLPKDYCLFNMTGEVSTDPLSNIGLVGADLAYIDEVFDLVPGSSSRMAPLVAMTASAGNLKPGTVLAGRSIVSGTMDAWAGLAGTGGAMPDSTVYLSGTSEILGISSSTVIPTQGAIVFPEFDGIRLHAAPTQCGGDAVAWFSEATHLSLQALSDLVAKTPQGTATPLFLPQLEGERAPLWDANLRAAFLGVSRRTGRGDLARAVYEGVALSARHALETLQSSSGVKSTFAYCGGGGFRSRSWTQIRADVLGIPLRTIAAGEPGVLGAATIAAVGSGQYSDFHQAGLALARSDEEFHPDPAAAARYDKLFVLYKKAIALNAELGKDLVAVHQ